MIFVTVGSQRFQFNRLLKKIDDLIKNGMLEEEVFAQIGYSDYRPVNYKFKDFLDREEFISTMERSHMVITHGGTGAIIRAVKNSKKVIAVPRLVKYGEHVDDHQIQIINQFDGMNIICACLNEDDLANAIRNINNEKFSPYQSNTSMIIESIDMFLKEV